MIISSWNKTAAARRVRRRYFNYLNSFEKKAVINPDETVGLCWLENFPFKALKYYRKHTRITGRVTDILIIYT